MKKNKISIILLTSALLLVTLLAVQLFWITKSFNDQKKSSIYVFGIGVKNKDKFQWIEKNSDNKLKDVNKIEIGKLHFKNSIFYKLLDKFK